jgi:hypothetical protein
MEKDGGKKNWKTVKISMPEKMYKDILAAKEPAWGDESEESFMRYLLMLGINDTEEELRQEEAVNAAMSKKAASRADILPGKKSPSMKKRIPRKRDK